MANSHASRNQTWDPKCPPMPHLLHIRVLLIITDYCSQEKRRCPQGTSLLPHITNPLSGPPEAWDQLSNLVCFAGCGCDVWERKETGSFTHPRAGFGLARVYGVCGQGLWGLCAGVMGSLGRGYGVPGQELWGLWAGAIGSLGKVYAALCRDYGVLCRGYGVSGQRLRGLWAGIIGSLDRGYGVSGQGLWGLWPGVMRSLARG